VNLGEWQGTAGQPPQRAGTITYDSLATFDIRQTDNAVAYIQQHAHSGKPFFMDINYIKMHNPTNAAPEFAGKSHLGDYSDSLMELDADIGRVMTTLRNEAPNTIVIVTADNGAWLDAYPDAGTTPFRGEKGSPFEGGWRVPGIMWWPGHIPAGAHYDEMMSRVDAWSTLAVIVLHFAVWRRRDAGHRGQCRPGIDTRGTTCEAYEHLAVAIADPADL
jgi:arylsulfatase